jgi:serine O-acetyltransferase
MTSKKIRQRLLYLINFILLIPYMFLMKWGPNNKLIKVDLLRWSEIIFKDNSIRISDAIFSFVKLMTFYPEYRSLFYYRLGWVGRILSTFILFKPMPTLYIWTKEIGPGLFIQHGFSTIISANKIGQNCWINQQVTIGFSNDSDCPTINDNVQIRAGAKVIGAITIGSNSVVGANAVVVKNVPENCTVVGVPAYIVRKNGVRTREAL